MKRFGKALLKLWLAGWVLYYIVVPLGHTFVTKGPFYALPGMAVVGLIGFFCFLVATDLENP